MAAVATDTNESKNAHLGLKYNVSLKLSTTFSLFVFVLQHMIWSTMSLWSTYCMKQFCFKQFETLSDNINT